MPGVNMSAVCVEDLVQTFSNGNETFVDDYAMFSRLVNGYMTLGLAAFGLIGNAALLRQVSEKKQAMSARLRAHLIALCVWDAVLLLSCSLCYGLLSIRYGIMPFNGLAAYMLLLQPLGSFAVSGTILQLTAITIERYFAVSRPLQERALKSRFSVKWICLSIFLLSALLNLPSAAFERALEPCWRIVTKDGVEAIQWSVMNVPTELDSNPIYTLLFHFIPDLIFRFPTPVVLIIILTVRTLQLSYRGLAASAKWNKRRMKSNHTLILLTLLNCKFLLCHATYMVNTAMDMLSHPFLALRKGHVQQTLQQFIRVLYMNDIANCLIVVHSATNWLLFIRQRRNEYRNSHSSSMLSTVYDDRSSSVVKSTEAADLLLLYHQMSPTDFAVPLLAALRQSNAAIDKRFAGEGPFDRRTNVRATASAIYSFMRDVVMDFASNEKRTGLKEARQRCRELGARHQRLGIEFRASDLKVARLALLQRFAEMCHQSEAPIVAHNIVSFVLCEMRTGALCEAIEARKASWNRPRKLSDRQSSDFHQTNSLLPLNDAHKQFLSVPDELTSLRAHQTSTL